MTGLAGGRTAANKLVLALGSVLCCRLTKTGRNTNLIGPSIYIHSL